MLLSLAAYAVFHLACGLAAIRIERRRHPELFTDTGGVVPFILVLGGPLQLIGALILEA